MNEFKFALAALTAFVLTLSMLMFFKNKQIKKETKVNQCEPTKPTNLLVGWGKGEQYRVPLDSIKISTKRTIFSGSEVNAYKIVSGLHTPNLDRLCDQGWFVSYNANRNALGRVFIDFVGKCSTSSRLMEFSIETDSESAEFNGTWHLSSVDLTTHNGVVTPNKGEFVLASESVQTVKSKCPLFWEAYSKDEGVAYLQRVLSAIDNKAEIELSKQNERIEKENQLKSAQNANVSSWN